MRDHLLHHTRGQPLRSTLDVLRTSGGAIGAGLADAFDRFPYRKGHWTVRALLQNSDVLGDYDFSFRVWLSRACQALGLTEFPPADFRRRVGTGAAPTTLEMALRRELERTFYQVGPALAAYMLCDWQLGLWANGRTAVFANFKWDRFHETFVTRYGRGVIPGREAEFVDWWLALYPDLPPRLPNECIWLATEHGDV